VSQLTAADRVPNLSIYASQLNIPDQVDVKGFPGYPQLTAWFGVCYDASWTAPTGGTYTFVSSVDDAVAMWIDGNLIGQNNYGDVQSYLFNDLSSTNGGGDIPVAFSPVQLNAGSHSVMIKYANAWPTNLGLRVWALPVGQSFKKGTTPSGAYFMQLGAPLNGVQNCP
jgi:hypothetical protein